MEYCNLGHSGLEVSRIALGAIPFGTWLDDRESRNMADMYLDAGGNFLDTSNIYGGGNSELTVGKVIRGRRDRFVVGTKGAWLVEKPMRPNAFGLSPHLPGHQYRGQFEAAGDRLHRPLSMPCAGPLHAD